jgi:rRNA-processing protein FCF1
LDVIVYIETNFLMSVAMGREARGDDLLAAIGSSMRVAIPSGCYMEAFSAFEDEQRRRNWFRAELERQIGQLRRDTTSANASELLRRLEESRIANDELLNDVQTRLFQLVDRAAGILEAIPESPAIIHRAVTSMLIADPTDNLILYAILDHAGRFAEANKVLLTDNTKDFATQEVLAALADVGVNKYFRSVTNLLGWLGSLQ